MAARFSEGDRPKSNQPGWSLLALPGFSLSANRESDAALLREKRVGLSRKKRSNVSAAAMPGAEDLEPFRIPVPHQGFIPGDMPAIRQIIAAYWMLFVENNAGTIERAMNNKHDRLPGHVRIALRFAASGPAR